MNMMAGLRPRNTLMFEDRYKEIQELIEDGKNIEHGDRVGEALYELMEGVYEKDPSIVKGINGFLSEVRDEFLRIRTLVAYGGQIYTLNKTKPFNTLKVRSWKYECITQHIFKEIDEQLEDMSVQLRDQIEVSVGVDIPHNIIPMVEAWYFDMIYENFIVRKLEENRGGEIPTGTEKPKSKWNEYLSKMG